MGDDDTDRPIRSFLRLPTRRLGLILVLAVLAVLASPQPAGAETTLDVTTPADGGFQPGRSSVPLLVTIEADEAVTGTLTARFEGMPSSGTQEVDVAGGTSKEIVFVVNVPTWARNGSVSFDADGDANDQTARFNLVAPSSDELVGVLPDLAARDLPATASILTGIGAARFYPVEPSLLDVGPDGLATFSQVVATASDLASLEGDRLDALVSWVTTDGGVLVVDEAPGTDLPFELTEEVGASGDTFELGLGTVVFSDGQAGAGSWDDLMAPTETRSPDEFPWGFFGGVGGGTNILATDAGVSVPAIGSLVIALIVYAAVVGPILWLVLRRWNREPLLWLIMPAVALVATGGIYLTGQSIRDDTATAHGTLVADLPSERIITSQVLVTSPNGGIAGVDLPAGWRAAPVAAEGEFIEFEEGFGGGPAAGVTAEVRGDELIVDLPPGGVGVVAAEGSQPVTTPSWDWDLTVDGDDLVGTITNLTAYDLEEVFVSSGRGFDRIPELEAGETAEVSLSGIHRPTLEGDPLMERLWQIDVFGGDDGGVINPVVLSNWLSDHSELRRPGYLIIVGWTRDAPAPVSATTGRTVDEGRTGFLASARLTTEELPPDRGRLEFLRGWNSTNVSDRIGAECSDFPLTVRLTPHGSVAPDDAVLAVPGRAIAALDVWDGTSWLPTGMAGAPRDDFVLELPARALDTGAVYARMTMSCDFWGLPDPFPAIRAADRGDERFTIDELVAAADLGGPLGTGPGVTTPPTTEPDQAVPTTAPGDEVTTTGPPSTGTTTETGPSFTTTTTEGP